MNRGKRMAAAAAVFFAGELAAGIAPSLSAWSGSGPSTAAAVIRGRPAAMGTAPSSPRTRGDEVLLEEDFETGALPESWLYRTTRAGGDSLPGSWFIAPTDPEIVLGSGRYCAWVNWDTTEQADEWMISPRLDLSDLRLEEVHLDFTRIYHDPAAWADEATLLVRISRDDGSSFPDTLYRVTSRSRPGVERVSIDISDYIGASTVRLGFQYSGQGGDSAGLDDIRVRTGLPVKIQRSTWGGVKVRTVPR